MSRQTDYAPRWKRILFRGTAIAVTSLFCFVIYLALVWSAAPQELLLGGIASVLVGAFASRFLVHRDPVYFFRPKRVLNYLRYLFLVFPGELVRANWDMAKRAFAKEIPLNPGIVRIPTEIRSDYGLMALCNAITLTPGTIAMDVSEDDAGNGFIYVHWIDVTCDSGEPAGDASKGKLEEAIGRVWK